MFQSWNGVIDGDPILIQSWASMYLGSDVVTLDLLMLANIRLLLNIKYGRNPFLARC